MRGKHLTLLLSCAVLGGVLALVGQLAGAGANGLGAAALLSLAGQYLRALSLSGFWGNLAAWVVTALFCLLPLGALLLKCRESKAWKTEDILAPLAVPVLFAAFYYAINPTLLPQPAGQFFPLAAGGCLLSMAVAWLVLKLLRGIETCPQERLSSLLSPLLVGGAALAAFCAAYVRTALFLARSQAVTQGNTADPQGAAFTCTVLGVLALLEAVPYLMGAFALVWGAKLAQALGAGFGAEAVELAQRTALGCRLVVQASVMLTLLTNLSQLALLGRLYSSHFSVYIPLFPLLACAGLFLLCRLVRQGRTLQEDNDSII